MARQFFHIVTVAPRGNFCCDFPIDMLRYDGLSPYQETDSSEIYRAIQGHYAHDGNELKVRLVRIAEKKWKPTLGRWDSFLWQVVAHEMRQYG